MSLDGDIHPVPAGRMGSVRLREAVATAALS